MIIKGRFERERMGEIKNSRHCDRLLQRETRGTMIYTRYCCMETLCFVLQAIRELTHTHTYYTLLMDILCTYTDVRANMT